MSNPTITPVLSGAAITPVTADVTIKKALTVVDVSKHQSNVSITGTSIVTENRVDYLTPIALGGLRVVSMTIDGLNYANSNAISEIIGFTRYAVDANRRVSIQFKGLLGGFTGLIAGQPIYLAPNGTITQTAPTVGVMQRLGVALDSGTINIQISTPTFLGI